MFRKGKHILTRQITLTYDTTGCAQIQRNTNMTDEFIWKFIEKSIISSELYTDLLELFAHSIPLGGVFFKKFVKKFLYEFNRKPTVMEQLEANLMGVRTQIELNKIFIETKE